MKRRILIFLTALLSIFAVTVPSAYASAPVESVTSSAVQSQLVTVHPPVVYANRIESTQSVETDLCGNPKRTESIDGMATIEVSASDVAESKLLPINRWADATSNFHTNIDEGMFSLNMERMTRETVAGTLFSISSTIWSGTTSTAIWATAFCPIDKMAGPIDRAMGKLGEALFVEGGAPLVTLLLIGLIGMALWNSRRGTGFQFAWKELLGKVAIIALILLMVKGAGDATDTKRGTGLSPANIVGVTNEIITNLATIVSGGLMEISEGAGYADGSSTKPTLSCQVGVHSLNEMYKTEHSETTGAGDLAASIPLMMSNSWVETGYMMWMRAQFGPVQGDLETSPQNNAACYVLDWASGLPQSSTHRDDLESRADLLGTVLRGGYSEGEFRSDVNALRGAITSTEGTARKNETVNRIIAPESEEEEHKAMMFLSICEPNPSGGNTGHDTGFWNVRSGFDTDKLDISAQDCRDAWGMVDGDFHSKHLDPFKMDNTKDKVYEKLGQGTPAADYVNYVNGSHPISAVGAGGIMLISSGILFVVFGFISLLVVLVRAALVIVIIYLFVMALKALFTKDSFQPLRKAAMLLIGMALLSVFVMMLYGLVVAMSSLMNSVGGGFMGLGSIPYLLWVTITPGLAILLLHFIFKWAKLPSPMTLSGAKAWGKGLALDGGEATINASGGSMSDNMTNRAKRGFKNAVTRMRGNSQRADAREGSVEGQMKEDRDAQQAQAAGGGSASSTHAEGSITGDLATAGSGGVATATAAGGIGGGPGGDGQDEDGVTRDDKKAVASLRQAEQREERKQKRADLIDSLKPRNIGGTAWGALKSGMGAMKARGVRGNLRKAASTAAKVAGITTVAGALGLTGGLPLMAAGVAGVAGARALKRRMEARGLVGRQNRETFARDVDAYVAAGRPEIEEERNSLRENLTEQAESVKQKAAETRAGQWMQDKVDAASDSIHDATDNVRGKVDDVKAATSSYWDRAKTGTASAATSFTDTFRPAHKQSGATDEQKDIAYATQHGFDAHDPEQLEAAHEERIKREEAAAKEQAEKKSQRQERRGRRAAHRSEVKEHNQDAGQQRRSAREAMNQASSGKRPQPVKLPDAPKPSSNGSGSDITGKGGAPQIVPKDGDLSGKNRE